MKRLPMFVLLAILVVAGAWYAFDAFFPDKNDATNPPGGQVSLTFQDEVALANLACGGHASVDAKKTITCAVCPTGSDFAGTEPGGGWTGGGVLAGSFTAPGQDEALLRASGCESHAKNSGGDFLFRRAAGNWSLVRYAPGAPASGDCLRALFGDGRDAVICRVTDMHQGEASDAVQLMTFDTLAPPHAARADFRKVNFVVTYDNSSNCGSGMSPVDQFDKVDRVYLVPSGTSKSSLTVKVSLARAKAAPQGTETCPATQPQAYTVNWKNLGDHFEAADGFVALAAKAADPCCELTVTQRVEPAKY